MGRKRKAPELEQGEDDKAKRLQQNQAHDEEVSRPPLPDEPIPGEYDQQKPPLPDEEPPPLPDEEPPPLPKEPLVEEQPPLPDEPLPSSPEESDEDASPSSSKKSNDKVVAQTQEPDAWQAIWEPSANTYYFYNTETKETTWLNPRIPREEAEAYLREHPPLIDPDYKPPPVPEELPPEELYDPETGEYAFTARFNAKTGKWQNNPEHTAENFTTEGQIMKTAKEYFDVTQMQQGRIVGQSGGALKAERRMMKIPKAQLKELIRRKREKKDKNKREWYRNDDIIVRKH